MATEFICKILPAGTPETNCDYATLKTWQTAHGGAPGSLKNLDLTSAATKVFSVSSGGTLIVDGDSVVGNTSGATGTCVHERYGKEQILIKSISGTFQSGETVQKVGDATKNVVLSNAGDSAILKPTCYAGLDSGSVVVDGYTTSSTNYIYFYVPTAERHTGIPGTGYRLRDDNPTSALYEAMNVKEDYVRIEGVSFRTRDSNSARLLNLGTTLGTSVILICYCFFFNSHSGYPLVDCNPGSSCTVKMWNNILRQTTGSPNWTLLYQSGTCYLYANTFVGTAANYGGGGIVGRTGGTIIAKGNLSDLNGATGCSAYAGSYDAASDWNHSSDTTAPGANTRKSVTPTYVDLPNNNVKLASGDTACKGYGSNISDANITFSDDILGTSRGATWDLGAHQVTVAAAGSLFRVANLSGVQSGGRVYTNPIGA